MTTNIMNTMNRSSRPQRGDRVLFAIPHNDNVDMIPDVDEYLMGV